MHMWSKSLLKLVWVAGLFGLIIIVYHLELSIKQTANETFNLLPLFFWFDSIASFLLGVYISLLFVKVWSFKINKSLLFCITLPCLIISFLLPTLYTVDSIMFFPSLFSNVPLPIWLYDLNASGVAQIVAGLGLFQTTEPQ